MALTIGTACLWYKNVVHVNSVEVLEVFRTSKENFELLVGPTSFYHSLEALKQCYYHINDTSTYKPLNTIV